MPSYLDSQGNYYEGDRQGDDLEVPQRRPSVNHIWQNGQWILDETKIKQEYKQQRDLLLSATDDIYSCDDYTIAGQPITTDQRAELKTYRQTLRDAPEKSYPNFPQKPSWLP